MFIVMIMYNKCVMPFPYFSPIFWSVDNTIKDTVTIFKAEYFFVVNPSLFYSFKIAYVDIALELFHLNISY